MTWSAEMVATLCMLKRAGYDFDSAWVEALRTHPPRGSEHRGELTLLQDTREVDAVEFLRRSAEDAWHGRRDVLRHLTPESFTAGLDGRGKSRRGLLVGSAT